MHIEPEKVNQILDHVYENEGIIPVYISDFISLNLNNRFKTNVIETLILFSLYKDTLKEIDLVIQSYNENIKEIKDINKLEEVFLVLKNKYPIERTKYFNLIENACKSKYFVKNFSKEEILEKEIIAHHLPMEIFIEKFILGEIQETIINKSKGEQVVKLDFRFTQFPTIDHTTIEEESVKKFNITFTEGTSIEDINQYIKDHIPLKKVRRKPKNSLWLGLILRTMKEYYTAEKRIKEKKASKLNSVVKKFFLRDYKNIYTKIMEEFKKEYNKKIDENTIKQNINRINQIQKEINS